jgi:hypothetical protein
MLPGLILPASLMLLLEALRPCFTARDKGALRWVAA